MVKSMRLIPTNTVGQAWIPREACYDQERGQSKVEKDTVTLNEEHGEILSLRKDTTSNAPWAAFGVRSVAAWRHLKTSSHDNCGEQYSPFLPSTSRPRRIGFNGEVAALESGLRKSRIAALLPREACFDGHRWRLACGASLPVAIDVSGRHQGFLS